ncbi:MAG: Radical SAM superfamily protein [Methanosaeta sp. PtaB.Bin039]|nr:MAG: Radical SAM superfamily protein [Methanosaeta sp. PtaB.Bin039]
MKMYFRLNPECYLIRGKKCGAIYDLIDEKIYALNQYETRIVTSSENNDVVNEDNTYLTELEKLRIGRFYKKKIYVQKLRAGSPIREIQSEPPAFHRAFLEINNICNRNCWFCGYNGVKRSLGCIGCNRWNENGESLSLEKWKRIINDLSDLDCKDIFIIGGDLTLVWAKTVNIVNYANSKFRNIYITLHHQSLSLDIANYLNNKANLIIQTDNINVPQYNQSSVIMVMNPDDWTDFYDMESKGIKIDFVIDDVESLSNNLPIISKKKILPVNVYKFIDNIEYHPCLGHTLAICHNGNVIPCPLMRSHRFGNVRNGELYQVFEKNWKEIEKIWKLNLDKIEKCKCCEFRYACTDCRALEENLTGKLSGKRLCGYNPIEGEWLK